MCANWKRGKRAQEQTEESLRTGVVGLLQGRTGRGVPGQVRMLEDARMDEWLQVDRSIVFDTPAVGLRLVHVLQFGENPSR